MRERQEALQLDTPRRCQRVLRDGDRALLTIEARWPRLAGEGRGARRIDRFYDALAQSWQKRWEGPLLDAARQSETTPWRASLDFTVTRLDGGVLSLYLDAAEDVGGRRPRRVRQGDVWSLPDGFPVRLRDLLPPRRWWRGPVLEEVRRQAGERIAAGESLFFDDWPRLCSRRFSPDRFYLTADGPVVFYPVESIAPALEGFPTFSLAALLPPPEGEDEKSRET